MSELWDIDIAPRRRRLTWWWWFWLLFFDGGDRPRQFMVLWSTKNARRVKVDDVWWERIHDIVREDGRITFDGMAASWFFDGEVMHDPLTLVQDSFVVIWDGDDGSLRSPDGGDHEHIYTATDGVHHVRVAQGGFDLDVRLEGDGTLGHPDVKQRVGPPRNGFSILRIKRLRFDGTLTHDGRSEDVTGTAYFQKVMVNAPAPPWYWGTLHLGDGSYIQYFVPHLGPPMLRRGRRQRSPLNRGGIPVTRSLDYHEARTGAHHRFRDVRVSRRLVGDLPVFAVRARNGGARIDMEIAAYARALWRFRQPLIGPLATVLFYNEYPARLTAFEFRQDGRTVGLDDVGGGIGNAEHSWGLLF